MPTHLGEMCLPSGRLFVNYRHIYHAGNFADVFKHVLLIALLEPFRRKEKPFVVLDSHAGIGHYDLEAVEATKTREWRDGVGRVAGKDVKAPSLVQYLSIVKNFNGGKDTLRWYPGSPQIARAMLRPQDRLMLNELHPEDAATLRHNYADDKQVNVHQSDGYAALRALLPPPERRGLVLIDPPFEKEDELKTAVKGLQDAEKRFGTGTFALWYPLKDRATIDRFHTLLCQTGIRDIIAIELCHKREDVELLFGSGLIVVRPPYGFVDAARDMLKELLPLLAQERGARAGIKVLVAE